MSSHPKRVRLGQDDWPVRLAPMPDSGRARLVEEVREAGALREITDSPIPLWFREEYEQNVERARQAPDPDRFAAAWAAGRVLKLEAAVAEALTVVVPSPVVSSKPGLVHEAGA